MTRAVYLSAAATLAALTLIATPRPALAQGTVIVTPGAADDDVTFGPEDDVTVRDYVVRVPPRRVYEETLSFRPGSVVPPDVELSPMADISKGRFARLAYFDAAGGKVVVVEPRTRTVVRILDR